jgi:hypothetical protein
MWLWLYVLYQTTVYTVFQKQNSIPHNLFFINNLLKHVFACDLEFIFSFTIVMCAKARCRSVFMCVCVVLYGTFVFLFDSWLIKNGHLRCQLSKTCVVRNKIFQFQIKATKIVFLNLNYNQLCGRVEKLIKIDKSDNNIFIWIEGHIFGSVGLILGFFWY